VARAKATTATPNRISSAHRELNKSAIASPSGLDQAIAAAEQSVCRGQGAEASEAIARLNLSDRASRPFEAAVAERIAIRATS